MKFILLANISFLKIGSYSKLLLIELADIIIFLENVSTAIITQPMKNLIFIVSHFYRNVDLKIIGTSFKTLNK